VRLARGHKGFRLVVEQGDDLVVFVVGGNELAIHKATMQSMNVIGLTILVHDVGAIQRKLTETGIAFDGPQLLRPGLAGITLRDPNGNTLAFLQPQSQ